MKKDLLSLHLTNQKFSKVVFARKLRKRMTETEKLLWAHLRGRRQNCKFRRQVPFGLYIADFCCMKHRLIIELDGEIHEELKDMDLVRDEILRTGSFRIIHFKNQDVLKDVTKVINEIKKHCA